MSGGTPGGYNPSPSYCGGANASSVEAIQNTLAQAMGGGLTNELGTVLWLENHATARVLWDLYSACERLGNQWDPAKMTVFLSRWEDILGLRPLPSDTLLERREHIRARLALVGRGTSLDAVYDYLSVALGPIFDGLEVTDPLNATMYCPGGATIPGGPTILDGANNPDFAISPYMSTVGYVVIRLVKPPEMSENEFYSRAAAIYDDVDGLFAAWVGYDWVRDGANGIGFYLDEDNNLDNQRFDV